MSFFDRWRRSGERKRADDLYRDAVLRAREPAFYERLAVPDTVEGRFDMVALHVYLILRRLKTDRAATETLAQALFDRMFVDMDENLREMGVGDLGVGTRVKKMAKAFYGRVAAYDAALAPGGPETLEEALHRNVYREDPQVDPRAPAALARYVREQVRALDAVKLETLLGEDQVFGGAAVVDDGEDL